MSYSRVHFLLILIVVCAFLFFYRLAQRDLWSSHEGRAAQNAQTMLWDDAWGLPKLFDGQIDMQKPPFFYWMVAAIGWLRGGTVDAWAVRLPAALTATGTVLWVFVIGCLRNRCLAGFLAAIVLATMVHFTWLARTGRIDTVLCFTISLTLGCFYCGIGSKKTYVRILWLAFGYLALAVAILLKGPIGFVLPTVTFGAYLFCERELPSPIHWKAWLSLLHRLGVLWGTPLVMSLTIPWFFWADSATGGEFSRVFLWHHNVQRGLGGSSTLASYPWWYYGPRLIVDLLPWSFLLLTLAWLFVRRSWWREDRLARFALIWFLAMVGLLSLSKFKRADYLLPAYPGAALFLGMTLTRWLQETQWRRRWVVAIGVVIVVYGLGWWVYLSHSLPNLEPYREQKRFANVIRRHFPRPAPIIFFRVEEHELAFHVGRPVDTIMEWENIDIWASRPGTFYMVMTPKEAREWPLHVTSGRLEEVARNTDFTGGEHETPLVLLRTCTPKEPNSK